MGEMADMMLDGTLCELCGVFLDNLDEVDDEVFEAPGYPMICEDCVSDQRKGENQMNKIYCFSNIEGGGDGPAIALGSDGTVLGSHWCSHEGYVPGDLGVIKGSRPDRHEVYRKHFPDGYEMEFVPVADLENHEGLQEAIRLNHLQGEIEQ